MINPSEYFSKGYYAGNITELTTDTTTFKQQVDVLRTNLAAPHLKWSMVQGVFGHPEFSHLTPSEEVETRKKMVSDNGYRITQQWGQLETPIDTNYFGNLLYEFGYKIYSQLTPECTYGFGQITSYKAGDLIEYHTDGQNPGRLFAGLIYLSDPYENGGGEIDIWETPYTTQDPDITVSPKYGNFVLIDFTKNNPGHAVRIVKDNFHRLCYLNFVSNTR